MSEDWRARRQTFDSVAEEYDQIRPGYPEQLFLDVIEDEYIRPVSYTHLDVYKRQPTT